MEPPALSGMTPGLSPPLSSYFLVNGPDFLLGHLGATFDVALAGSRSVQALLKLPLVIGVEN